METVAARVLQRKNVMPTSRGWGLLSVLAVVLITATRAADKPLTNDDVLNLVRAGFNDAVVIAKIKEAKEAAFATDAEALIALRRAGVSDAVVQAILEHGSRAPAPAAPAAPLSPFANPFLGAVEGSEPIRVRLVSADGERVLKIARGEVHFRGFMGFGVTFMDYPGAKARVRTQDSRPHLLVYSTSPLSRGRYFLVKLNSDRDDDVRSLKLSSVRQRFKAAFKPEQFMKPDPDCVVKFQTVEGGQDLWKVSSDRDLETGEYGFYIDIAGLGDSVVLDWAGMLNLQSGGIFDFAVDRK